MRQYIQVISYSLCKWSYTKLFDEDIHYQSVLYDNTFDISYIHLFYYLSRDVAS